ncbi:unnamed protein product [Meganyctiphanes norvegica]|uniref:Uncharacterized protein n=1 Tax=Meganyctiphanes norvegica TaxID=48144 RepID=A0AAV2RJY7_MEGNR
MDTVYSVGRGLPFLGRSGLNSGVMLMNLARLRSIPGGGFTNITKNLYLQYKNKIGLGDQDIINIFFALHPTLYHELGCNWDYGFIHCQSGHNICLDAEKNGASLVHGMGNSFRNGRYKHLMALYDGWREHELGTPIQILVSKIQEKQATQNHPCLMTQTYFNVLTKQLSLYTISK